MIHRRSTLFLARRSRMNIDPHSTRDPSSVENIRRASPIPATTACGIPRALGTLMFEGPLRFMNLPRDLRNSITQIAIAEAVSASGRYIAAKNRWEVVSTWANHSELHAKAFIKSLAFDESMHSLVGNEWFRTVDYSANVVCRPTFNTMPDESSTIVGRRCTIRGAIVVSNLFRNNGRHLILTSSPRLVDVHQVLIDMGRTSVVCQRLTTFEVRIGAAPGLTLSDVDCAAITTRFNTMQQQYAVAAGLRDVDLAHVTLDFL
ncbi:hypothetical protein LTR95_000616 [Oleoguttula sp. CCFEE 5521]